MKRLHVSIEYDGHEIQNQQIVSKYSFCPSFYNPLPKNNIQLSRNASWVVESDKWWLHTLILTSTSETLFTLYYVHWKQKLYFLIVSYSVY